MRPRKTKSPANTKAAELAACALACRQRAAVEADRGRRAAEELLAQAERLEAMAIDAM